MSRSLADVIDKQITLFKEDLFTCLPAKITSVDKYATKGVISATPSINNKLEDGTSFPSGVIPDVPVQFPSGGGAIISFPLAVGDEVILVFSMKSLEDWFASTEDQVATQVVTLHNEGDAIAIPCIYRPSNSPTISTDNLEIKFGDSSISISPDNTIIVDNGTGSSTINNDGSITNNTSSTFAVNGAVDELVDLINQLAQQVALITVSSFGAVPNNAATITTIQNKIAAFVETP